MAALGPKEEEIMRFLHERVFDPILASPKASSRLKQGVQLTINRMSQRDAVGMVAYFWAALKGTPKSVGFAELMRREGFERFEEALVDFRARFNDAFLRRK